MIDTDNELLRRYADQGDEGAFAEVVRRHTDLVYSVALRVTNNRPLAEDATQAVFTKLVRHARLVSRRPTIIGWLHVATRNTAIDTLRSENRRRIREHEAFAMHIDSIRDEMIWAQLRPALDEAVSRLNPRDREVLLLRFFKGLSHQEVGAALGLSENAANKCTERALEKIRAHFNRDGVMATAAILATAISANSVQAAPTGLAANATKRALAAGAGAGSVGASLWTIFLLMNTKTKTLLAIAILTMMIAAIAIKLAPSSAASAARDLPMAPAHLPPSSPPKANGTPTVAAPAVASGAKAATNAPEDKSANAVARRELNSTMDEIIALLQSGNAIQAAETFLSPASVEAMGPDTKQLLKEQMQALIATPKGPELVQKAIRVLNDMKTQSPNLNATGDRASYSIHDPEDPTFSSPDITFRKMDGKWYFIMPKSEE